MASARHRPLPSSARNPFDSSDDEEEVKRVVPTAHRHEREPHHYSNPFDDEDDHGRAPPDRHAPASKSSHPQPEAYANNPFDDDDDDHGVEYGGPARQSSAPSLKTKLDQGTLFDEEPRFHGNLSAEEGKARTRSSPAKASLKKMQRIKDAGASQASRMVEGGLHQAQRLKETSISAFKSNEAKGLNEGKGKPPVVLGNGRNQLFKEDARRGVPAKGGHGFSDEGRQELFGSGSLGMPSRAAKPHYDDYEFRGDNLEQKSVQELEGYALQKSEDTTKSLQNCLKVAEDIRADATQTLVNLHQQGEQLKRTHEIAHDIDQNLTAGEKLLGSLGGMFSRTWKPKKAPAITGPIDDPSDMHIRRKGHHLEQRTALGLDAKRQSDHPSYGSGDFQSQATQAKLELEKSKQEDALSDLSNVLDQLKGMSMDMNNEISRQNVALEHFQNDVTTLDYRMKGANERGRHLLRK